MTAPTKPTRKRGPVDPALLCAKCRSGLHSECDGEMLTGGPCGCRDGFHTGWRSNPPESPWFNGGSRASRKSRKAEFSLPPEAHAAIERMAARGRGGNRSRAVAEAVIAADAREDAEGKIVSVSERSG